MPEPKTRRIPHPIWFAVAAAMMVVLAVFLSVWPPYHRELSVNDVAHADEQLLDSGATVQAVVELIERYHIKQNPLDDMRSAKWLNAFLHRLDPKRMYFLEADYAEFRIFEKRLDDLAKRGDFEFAKLVRKRYRQRVTEAKSYAERFLAVEHDFSIDEEFPLEFREFSEKSSDLQERWRLRIKFETLIEKLHGTLLSETKSRLRSRYQRIARDANQMTDERLCQIYLNSLTNSYDPHSGYMSETGISTFSQTLTSLTYSLGLSLDQRSGQYIITSIHSSFQDSPSPTSVRRGGILGWNLIAIRTIDGTTHDIVEMNPEDLTALIYSSSGPLGTENEVILELLHPVTFDRLTLSWNRISL